MMLDREAYYQILATGDPRFDGRFFVGVSSTGIYCRPVCRARRPKLSNCTFFPSAAAAEAAGYRPCLLCRPELAPGNAGVDATSRLAQRAAGLIEEGAVGAAGARGLGLDAVAQQLGVTPRHLRRVFKAEFGVSPVAFAQTHRLLLAKRLLSDTRLSMTEVACACGFGSVRRFNALFKERYRLNPTALRQDTKRLSSVDTLVDTLKFELAYRPPLDWDALLGFLGFRAIEGVESVAGATYYRTLRIEHQGETHSGWIAAAPSQKKPALTIVVSASLSKVLPRVLGRAKQAFDLSSDPQTIAAGLGDLADGHPGLRLPGSWDGCEILTRAILGQQVTVQAARTLASRLVMAFGEPLRDTLNRPAELSHLFPTAARLAATEPADIQALGVVGARARAVVTGAQAIASGDIVFESGVDPATLHASLRQLPGVGDWTAEYVVMRGLSWPDCFPATDRGLQKAMQEDNSRRALARAEAWRPWRSYAVMHLWQTLTDPADRQPKDPRDTEGP